MAEDDPHLGDARDPGGVDVILSAQAEHDAPDQSGRLQPPEQGEDDHDGKPATATEELGEDEDQVDQRHGQ